MRSGWLTSPVECGQSWLAHSPLESGLTISSQTRYRALLASRRAGLQHLAARSGFRTAAIMPGISMAWPEGPAQGFEIIPATADLGYRGQPFNVVTIPDQYTLRPSTGSCRAGRRPARSSRRSYSSPRMRAGCSCRV
ncbi:hypothetical protein OSH08_16720 [Kaistia geumhonensis]|uniref:Uncharacterized protein n=1 Tax=Kaistia geumhonensis TaxID=410839 RepID=A0ABU0MA15_9HYPH|nr:hypothetical protein [Kaistia geumhonensis]MCX5480646.1 hypothetical protein [Kaistia geumhonensis]MDQ0517650.1 hypothetical protein [Kaistia geumhonensis]